MARHENVRLRALDEHGRAVDEVFTGWPARIVQHETDHLDGTLYLDRAELRSLSSREAMADRWAQPTPAAAAEALGFDLGATPSDSRPPTPSGGPHAHS